MFDWNDEELANIIWGEASESDDHIVPYRDESKEKPPDLHGDYFKKEWNQEAANTKPAERKKPVAKTDFLVGKLESDFQYGTNEGLPATGFGMDSWPDLSLSNAAKTDQDSMGTEASNNLTEISKYDSSRGDETARLDDGSQMCQNQHEDREEGDFVDYGWANIGSFDDFERIFSNDDPIFGHVSLGNADELWSSSKDVTSSPEKSIPLSMDSLSLGLGGLRSTSDHLEIKTEYVLDQDRSFTPGCEKMNDLTSHASQNVQAGIDHIEYTGGTSNLLVKDKTALEMVGKTAAFNSHLDAETVATPNEFADKLFSCVQVNRPKKLLKSRKKSEEKGQARQLQDLCGTWSPSGNQFQQFDGRYAPSVGQPCPSPSLSHQMQLQGPESLPYKHFSNPLLAPSVYENVSNQYPDMPVLPQLHFGEGNHQLVPSGHEASPGNSSPLNKAPDAPLKPLTMTPQEKIEKLRRRQQMRAMLAIKKQQQQFDHQVSCTEHSIAQKCSHENQMQLMEGGNIEVEENLSSLPSLDPNSPLEQDDSNTNSMAIDDCSVEDTILYRLQDIIVKLDIKIRLCIRDSLFRLAQSAMQRQYASDTSSTNKSSRDEVFTKEGINSHNRFARMPDVETETNPIDRTVANLLFHRPPEFSGKLPETPESPASTMLPCERKATGLMSLPVGLLPENSRSKKNLSHQGSKIPCLFHVADQSKSCSCVDTSENASNNEAPDGGSMEVEASQ